MGSPVVAVPPPMSETTASAFSASLPTTVRPCPPAMTRLPIPRAMLPVPMIVTSMRCSLLVGWWLPDIRIARVLRHAHQPQPEPPDRACLVGQHDYGDAPFRAHAGECAKAAGAALVTEQLERQAAARLQQQPAE